MGNWEDGSSCEIAFFRGKFLKAISSEGLSFLWAILKVVFPARLFFLGVEILKVAWSI